MKYRFRFLKMSAIGLALGLSGSPAYAEDYLWDEFFGGSSGSADWDIAVNWTGGSNFPNDVTDTAAFGNILTGNLAVSLNQSITLDSLIFNNSTASSLSITTGTSGELTFDACSMLTYNGTGIGNFNINSSVTLNSDFTITNNNENGAIDLQGIIDGTAFVTKTGSGIVVLSATNAYTGDTIVTGGTLQLAATNALGDTLSATNVTLDTGTIQTTGAFNINKSGAQLTIDSTGTINLFAGAHDLTFGTVLDTSNVLTVEGWTGDVTGGTNGRLLFVGYTDATDANNQAETFIQNVQFSNSTGTGGTFIDVGPGVVQLVPVPEPMTVFGISAAGLGLAGWIRRRREVAKS